ncbi:hypothetical protein [Radiobacillus sp. PE A8.2]|uniref:hypothetical protein n=1 Tax=Radiobacillus sp. PE A8.2 TaxID=3380349 RepID=UPI00388D9F00
MRFEEDLLQLYLRHFDNNDEESLEHFIQSVLEQMDEKDLLEVIHTCKKEELHSILSKHLQVNIENKLKFEQYDIDDNDQLSI